MLSLKSFHLFFIAAAIVLATAVGAWGLVNRYVWLGVVSLAIAILLVIYEGYFAGKSTQIGLK